MAHHYTTPWSAPQSPAPISPLHVRRGPPLFRESYGMSRSPVSPREVSPSSEYSRDSNCFSHRSSRAFTAHQTRRQSTRSSRSHGYSGKSPIEESDYSGLQLDDRPEHLREKILPPLPPAYKANIQRHIVDEKRDNFTSPSPHPLVRSNAPFRTQYSGSVPDPTMKEAVVAVPRATIHQTVENYRRRRRRMWILAIIVLLIVIAGVIAGAIIGTQMRESHVTLAGPSSASSPPMITPTAAPDVINAALPPKDIQVDSQLVPVQFVANTSNNGQSAGAQNFGIWYQNKCGNVKGVQNAASWDPYGTAFTDAVNVSGLAGINFFNDSVQSFQTYLFYIGVDGNIRDKKLNPKDNTFEIASLAPMHVGVKPAPQSALTDNSSSPWDGYKMAAVYSENFPQGPGARLFYHSSNGSGNYLQELIWLQTTDKWSYGTTIGTDALPISHLSMVADEDAKVVRLMYAVNGSNSSSNASASPSLQEYYMPLGAGSTDGGFWKRGQRFDGLLQHGSSAFALAASGGTSYLYHIAPLNSSGPALQVRELTLPRAGSSDAIDMGAAETVAQPDWLAQDTGGREASLYTPLAAVGSKGMVSVFFADGTVDALAGYAQITTVSRQQGKSWGPADYGQASGQVSLPLDAKCSLPQI